MDKFEAKVIAMFGRSFRWDRSLYPLWVRWDTPWIVMGISEAHSVDLKVQNSRRVTFFRDCSRELGPESPSVAEFLWDDGRSAWRPRES